MPEKVALATLGCKMNQADSEAIREAFEQLGCEIVPFSGDADLYIINTCTVTGAADQQCRNLVHRALRRKEISPSTRVIVTGCYAQTAPADLEKLLPGVDLIAGNLEKARLPELLKSICPGETSARIEVGDVQAASAYDPVPATSFGGHTRAFLRVQDGCDNRCSYCIVPVARGPARSLPMAEALLQARRMAENGYLEIVVTGIHAGRYGADLSPKESLAALLRRLHGIPGIRRIRLSSLEPGEITDEFLGALPELPLLCPHFHISLQSGDERILRLMRRTYPPQKFLKNVHALRERTENPCIGADVIVGFPSEDDAAFRNTHDIVLRARLAYLHVFRYSIRPGTPAADMPSQTPDNIKRQRSNELLKIRSALMEEYRAGFVGRTLEVLFERRTAGPGAPLSGLTANYLRVFAPGPDSALKKIVPVKIISSGKSGVIGEIL